MESIISVVACVVGQPATVVELENDLTPLQKFVGGYLQVVGLADGCVLVCNEEGKIRNLPDNRIVPSVGMIKGDYFICGVDEDGEFTSLSEEQKCKFLAA